MMGFDGEGCVSGEGAAGCIFRVLKCEVVVLLLLRWLMLLLLLLLLL